MGIAIARRAGWKIGSNPVRARRRRWANPLLVAMTFGLISGFDPTAARAADEDELDEAVRRAEAAADDAWLAARAADRKERESRPRSALTGFFIGGEIAYAAENFDDSILVKSSLAGAAFAGYRPVHFFAAELRYEGFDGFDLKASNGHGEIDGYAISVNGKLYPLEGPIQPYMGVGVGGMRLDYKARLDSGARDHESDSDAVFRFIAGIDLPVTDHVILNFDAAYLLPTDDLSDFPLSMLGAGVTYLF
jgi:opacity protein-like surface antigen